MTDKSAEFKQCKYFEHAERPASAAPGERVVEFLKIAYCQDAPPGWNQIAVYRPLDTQTFVYKKGGWDYRPLAEFLSRYKPVTDDERVAELDRIAERIYAPFYRVEQMLAVASEPA
jgi:hypothetical protein